MVEKEIDDKIEEAIAEAKADIEAEIATIESLLKEEDSLYSDTYDNLVQEAIDALNELVEKWN